MGLFRLIFLGVVVWLIYRAVRFLLDLGDGGESTTHRHNGGSDPGGEAAHGPVDKMVRCAQCGLHIPEDEAVRDGGVFFCSTEHRDRYRRG